MRRALLAIVSTVAGLVFLLSYKTHSPSSVASPFPVVSTTTSTKAPAQPSAKPSAKAPAQASVKTPAKATASTTTGDAVQTRYGPVQVAVTVVSGKVTAATAVVYPANDPRDEQINSYAIPALNQEAVRADSANIDMVSGATYTSQGYIQSLQSALDKAGI